MIHAFTSINVAYLPKARVLGHSLKKWHPEIRFHLMLSDQIPDWFVLENEPFDSVITPQDLAIDNLEGWIFKHSVVELCTAVKPFAFRHIITKHNAEKVFYFDPDCVLFSRADNLIADLDSHSVVLTPHICSPETTREAIIDTETSCLRHGIYNLGFLGVRTDEEGMKVVNWWCDRLYEFCQDNIPFGLFTDQRWMDFVPACFERVRIAREPEYNVATWNYTTRKLTGNMADGVLVDGRPLCFHHFSGVDSGNAEMMLRKYSKDAPVVWELNHWYEQACAAQGQGTVSLTPWLYGFYDNGEKVSRDDRLLYRNNPDLQAEFPEPFHVNQPGRKFGVTFYDWLRNNTKQGLSQPIHVTEPFLVFLARTESSLLSYVRLTKRLRSWQKRGCERVITKLFGFVRWLGRCVGVKVGV